MRPPFFLQVENIYAVPILHYNMESAIEVKKVFDVIGPDCVAVELAETMQLQLLHAAARLPDISVVTAYDTQNSPIYYLCEPCDGAFEALRSALDCNCPAFCIDLDISHYPDKKERFPDSYAIHRIGLAAYYRAYMMSDRGKSEPIDKQRELYMAQKLKELSYRYEKVLFVGGMYHVERVLSSAQQNSFPSFYPAVRSHVEIATLKESSARNLLAEPGFISQAYEEMRHLQEIFYLDRQKLIYRLFKEAAVIYQEATGIEFSGYHFRNIMNFLRKYTHFFQQLLPDLFQILTAAKGCVDHNYAYEVWQLATSYPYIRNIDNLHALELSVEDVWGHSKMIQFHMRLMQRKKLTPFLKRKDRSEICYKAPNPFSICSYPPEDILIEHFSRFLQKKVECISERSTSTMPFTAHLEDGVDVRETIRHWHEEKLYVKTAGKPLGGVGSVVVIFDEDGAEKYSWKTTWLGEHSQESDMAFYATPTTQNIVGPGISRCQYGGFLLSYPPRRICNVWSDPDYHECKNKAEVLLCAAIDYAVKTAVVYVASSPPRNVLKNFAGRFGKKIVYIPIGQLSPITLAKLRIFHVLDGQNRRDIAGEYIF